MDINSLLSSKLNQRLATAEHVKHAFAVQSARARIDTSSPRTYTPTHTYLRGKALRYFEDRRLQIQRDNHLLLSRLMSIRSPLPKEKKTTPKSLNLKVRIDEMKRINQENTTLLEAISTAKPRLKRKEWDKFEKDVSPRQNQKYRELIRAVTPQFQAPQPTRTSSRFRRRAKTPHRHTKYDSSSEGSQMQSRLQDTDAASCNDT